MIANAMRLHPQLSLLVAGAVAPVLVLAMAAGVLLVRHERQTMQSEAIGRTRSAMSAVDAEIRGHFTAIQALAASKTLETGDLAAYYDEAQRVLRGQSDWLTVRLALATESQIFDTTMPFGKEIPPINDLTSFRLAVASRQPVVSDVDTSVQPSGGAHARAGGPRFGRALRAHGANRAGEASTTCCASSACRNTG